tara:strand:- start:183 stop:563 length:381 start_codon:yes stop_codon:yes gene_type:complete
MKHKMTLDLHHGRADPDRDMDDWGTQGPLLYVDCVLVTYSDSIRLQFTGQPDVEFLSEYVDGDCFFYDGVYYGDWSIQPLDDGEHVAQGKTPELFSPEKAKHVALRGSLKIIPTWACEARSQRRRK